MDKANPPPLVSAQIRPRCKVGKLRTEGEMDRGGRGGRIEGKKDRKLRAEGSGMRDRELCKCTTL